MGSAPSWKGLTLSHLQALFAPVPAWPAKGRLLLYAPGAEADELNVAAERLGLRGGATPQTACVVLPGAPGPAAATLPVLAADLAQVLPALLALPVRPALGAPPIADSLRTWAVAARLALDAVIAQRLVPALRAQDGVVRGVWRVEPADGGHRDALARLAAAMPRAAHALPIAQGRVWEPLALLEAFEDAVADLAARTASPLPVPGRPRARLLPWTARWAAALADPADPEVPLREDVAAELLAGVRGWGRAEAEAAGALHVELFPPDDQDGPWPAELGLLGHDGVLREARAVWAADGPDAAAWHEALLRGIALAARLSPPFEQALHAAAPERVVLDRESAWHFLRDAAPALREAGVVVALPEGLDEQALRLRLVVGDEAAPVADGPAVGPLDEEEVGARWEVDLGGEPLDDDALEALWAEPVPLVRRHGVWLLLDPGRLLAVRRLRPPPRMTLGEALALALAGTRDAAGDLQGIEEHGEQPPPALVAEVESRGRVAVLIERILAAAEPAEAAGEPEGFTGELRGYQRRGVAWLGGMAALGLGAVLADDMGLGKTVQLIAHLLGEDGGGGPTGGAPDRHLIVCPTSVLGNWQRELARFAPELPVTRFHGGERPEDLGAVRGVVLTSYGMLRREVDVLAGVDWQVVAVDEAQHVKNPDTAGAKALRRLRAAQKVALTGTPLENRLADLWALMDLVNPGLLGTRRAFERRFGTPVERRGDPAAARRLRRLVAPFLLRREKADPSVAVDLPDKIEREVVCGLTAEQAQLYEEAVAMAFADGLGLGMARRGRVLALLTALKQICNHPAQYRREEDGELAHRSGKLAVAREIVRAAVDADEQLVVFTQFTTMGRLLVRQLEADLRTEVPFLHGGVGARARDRMVAGFQGEGLGEPPPVLVVSLRAGGTGLNLTAASHVLHYDRWWNPAVEDQATDRAHRIGQERTVEVHKLVTAGTVEERIAAVLGRKRGLAGQVVGTGESWVTELGDEELRELVALSGRPEPAGLDEDWEEVS